MKEMVVVTEKDRRIFFASCKSFLYSGGEPWVKKGEDNFDVGMGAFQGAQVCEAVGLYVLSQLKAVDDLECILCRDDGSGVTRSSPQVQERIRQQVKAIFREEGLAITITVNLTSVDYLDVTMDLGLETYKPYRKLGDRPLYVSAREA